MPQQKSSKKPTKSNSVKNSKKTAAAKPTARVSAKRTAPRKPQPSKKKKTGFRAALAGILYDKRKWVSAVIFIVMFGGIGAYFISVSSAAYDMNDFGCAYSKTSLPSGVIYKSGSPRSACVYMIQDTLRNRWGHTVITKVDGVYGPQTVKAVTQFQQRHVHKLTADGKVGAQTWQHLKEGSAYRTTSTPMGSSSATSTGGTSINLARAAQWDIIAKCESGGNWSINTGNGYYGGLQFNLATWKSMKGTDFAAYPHQATRAQQITVANRLYAVYGYAPWPVCGKKV